MVIEIDGQIINYETAGAGKTVLFLHGWGGGMASFKGCFNVLKNGSRVINLELPGFGQSSPPLKPFGAEDYARIVLRFIEAVCGTNVSLVAHSFGGRIALILAAEHPELIDKLILIDGAGLKPRRGLLRRLKIWRYKLAKVLVKRKLIRPESLNKYGSDDWRALSPAMRATFDKVVNKDLSGYAAHISAPALLIWGGKDKDTPLYMAKRLRKLIRGSELRVFPRAGHYSYIDKFWECNELMRKFLE